MKKLLSTKYSAGAFNAAMLLLRLVAGGLMIKGGYYKLTHFSEIAPKFMNFLGMGQSFSLALLIFAEFFCSMFIILGLFTRLAAIPLIIAMGVALVKAHNSDVFGEGLTVTLFLTCYLTLFILGPGKISMDKALGK